MIQLIIFGAGGHAREVAQIVVDINQAVPGTWQLLRFMAEPGAASAHPQPLPAPFLGHSLQTIEDQPKAQYLIAVGNAHARRRIAAQLQAQNPSLRFATLIGFVAQVESETRWPQPQTKLCHDGHGNRCRAPELREAVEQRHPHMQLHHLTLERACHDPLAQTLEAMHLGRPPGFCGGNRSTSSIWRIPAGGRL